MKGKRLLNQLGKDLRMGRDLQIHRICKVIIKSLLRSIFWFQFLIIKDYPKMDIIGLKL